MKLNPLNAESRVKNKYFEFHYKLRLKWVSISLFLLFSGNAFSQSYNYRNFSTEDGLPQAYIYSLTQDVNGYLWIGTGNGLSRYNGFRLSLIHISEPTRLGISYAVFCL